MDMARSKFLALMVIDSHYTGLRTKDCGAKLPPTPRLQG